MCIYIYIFITYRMAALMYWWSTHGVFLGFFIPRPGKRVKLQIWDTAGQERFQTITQQQDSQIQIGGFFRHESIRIREIDGEMGGVVKIRRNSRIQWTKGLIFTMALETLRVGGTIEVPWAFWWSMMSHPRSGFGFLWTHKLPKKGTCRWGLIQRVVWYV